MPQTLIKFGIYDTTARENAKYSGSGLQGFTNFEILRNDAFSPGKLATLEQNNWILDGNSSLAANNIEGASFGILSQSVSDAAGQLSGVTVAASFTQPHTSAGITIKGDVNTLSWASHVNIQWLGLGGDVMQDIDFYPDEVDYFCETMVEGYYGLLIVFIETNKPFSFSRLNGLRYGMEYIFEESELQTANIVKELSPISECLTSGELNFTAVPKSSRFDLLNPSGAFGALQTGQALEVFTVVNDIQTQIGHYYLDEWNSDGKIKLTIRAIDVVGMLVKQQSDGGMFDAVPIESVINGVFGALNGVRFAIDLDVQSAVLSGWLPISDYREILQNILFAIGAVAVVLPDGSIRIKAMHDEIVSTFDSSRKFISQNIEQRKDITDAEVVALSYVPGDEIVELLNDTFEPGDYTISFSEPMHGLTITGGIFTQEHVNLASFSVVSNGDVLISGKTYDVTEKSYRVKRTTPLAGGARAQIAAKGVPTMSDIAAQKIAQNVYEYYTKPKRISFSAILQNEDIGDMVRVYANDRTTIIGNIVKMQTSLIGMITIFDVVGSLRDVASGNDFQRVNIFYPGVRAQ